MLVAILFALSVSANSVYAADTCCVDKDIAAAFLLHATYSRDWPASFPIEPEIAGFEYIGSSKGYEGRSTSVAWKSELNAQPARELVADTLLAKGWVAVPDHNGMRVRYERGFIPHQPIVIGNNQQFCRDRDGSLNIQARQTDIGTIVTLSHSRNRAGRDCAGMIAERRVQPSYTSGLMSYLPALALPETVKMSLGGGSGGGSDGVHASTSVETNVSAAEIIFYFEPQMTTQQWTMDTRFQGNVASGHIWRRAADGLNLICIVTAFDSGDRLRLRMHVEPL